MEIVTVHKAKTQLSELLVRVEAGEEIILARGNQPIAKLVPLNPHSKQREFGVLRGLISVGPEFFEPLPEEEINAWE